MIIDFHTHCFPDALAPKALAKLSAHTDILPSTDGTVSGLKRKMLSDGVDISVVCNIATNAHQQRKVNDFAVAVNERESVLTALGSVYPESEEISTDLDYLSEHDIRGIKIHPEYTSYYIDDPIWERVFSECSERNIFVITHAGFDFISPDRIAATPERIARVLDKFPKLTLIAAHLGSNRCWEEVKNHLCGRENLYFDTAIIGQYGISPQLAREIIDAHGHERILFGSDTPWSEAIKEINFIRSLGLSEESLEMIFHRNAERILF